jgi:hypothetical protein
MQLLKFLMTLFSFSKKNWVKKLVLPKKGELEIMYKQLGHDEFVSLFCSYDIFVDIHNDNGLEWLYIVISNE